MRSRIKEGLMSLTDLEVFIYGDGDIDGKYVTLTKLIAEGRITPPSRGPHRRKYYNLSDAIKIKKFVEARQKLVDEWYKMAEKMKSFKLEL